MRRFSFFGTMERHGTELNGTMNGTVRAENERNGIRNGTVQAQNKRSETKRTSIWPILNRFWPFLLEGPVFERYCSCPDHSKSKGRDIGKSNGINTVRISFLGWFLWPKRTVLDRFNAGKIPVLKRAERGGAQNERNGQSHGTGSPKNERNGKGTER